MGFLDRRAARVPDQAALDGLLEGALTARIAEVEAVGGRELLVVDRPSEVQELSRLLAILRPTERFHCLCPGDQTLEFSRGRRGKVAITLHHGRSIRWEGWDSDAMLADAEGLLRWLDEHGAPEPLRAWEKSLAREEHDRAAWEAWKRATPPSVVPLLAEAPATINPELPLPESLQRASEALRAGYPNEREEIRALLEWFGSGEGPWSGFPSYECVAEALLLRYPTEAILLALDDEQLTPTLAEGAARLFASWWFGRMRPGDAARLPADLARRLRRHVGAAGDPDKIARLFGALGR